MKQDNLLIQLTDHQIIEHLDEDGDPNNCRNFQFDYIFDKNKSINEMF